MPQPTPPRRSARLLIAVVAFASGLAVVLLGAGGRPAGAAESAPTPTTAAPTTAAPKPTTTVAPRTSTTIAPKTTTTVAPKTATTVTRAPATTTPATTAKAAPKAAAAPRAAPTTVAPTTVVPTTVPVAGANGVVTPPALLVDGPVATSTAADGGLGPFVKLYGAAAGLALVGLLCGLATARYWWRTRPGTAPALARAAAHRPGRGRAPRRTARPAATSTALASTRTLASSTARVATTSRPFRRATDTTGWGADRPRPTHADELDRTAEFDLVL